MQYVSFTAIPLLVVVSDSIWKTNSYALDDFRDTPCLANHLGMVALNVYFVTDFSSTNRWCVHLRHA